MSQCLMELPDAGGEFTRSRVTGVGDTHLKRCMCLHAHAFIYVCAVCLCVSVYVHVWFVCMCV